MGACCVVVVVCCWCGGGVLRCVGDVIDVANKMSEDALPNLANKLFNQVRVVVVVFVLRCVGAAVGTRLCLWCVVFVSCRVVVCWGVLGVCSSCVCLWFVDDLMFTVTSSTHIQPNICSAVIVLCGCVVFVRADL